MPSPKVLRARGGVRKVRTVRLAGGRYAHVFVVGKRGPRGGSTELGEIKRRRAR